MQCGLFYSYLLILSSVINVGNFQKPSVAMSITCYHGNTEDEINVPPGSMPDISQYELNLDLPPQSRWGPLVKQKKQELNALFDNVESFMKELLGERIFSLIYDHLPYITETLPSPYYEELKGMAASAYLPLPSLTMYNIFYELFVLCTSIVVEDTNGNIFHGRNLDNGALLGWDALNHTWRVTELLKPMTVNVIWKKDNVTVFESVQFVGYVGVLTAVKKGKFSLSIDKRIAVENGLVGLIEWLLLKDHKQSWVSFLAREVMEKSDSFSDSQHRLSHTRLLAPAYYILSGTRKGQGVIITRDRDNFNLLPLAATQAGFAPWFIVATNYDHWKQPPFFDDRRYPTVHCLKEATQHNASMLLLANVLSTKPVINKSTVYTSLMSSKEGTIKTWIRSCPDPCWPW